MHVLNTLLTRNILQSVTAFKYHETRALVLSLLISLFNYALQIPSTFPFIYPTSPTTSSSFPSSSSVVVVVVVVVVNVVVVIVVVVVVFFLPFLLIFLLFFFPPPLPPVSWA